MPAAWFLTLEAKGRWEHMKNSFLSLLIPAGSLVSSPSSNIAKLVLRSTPFGVFLYKCRQRCGNILELAPDPSQTIEFISVQSPAGAGLSLASILPQGAGASSATLCLKHKGKAFSLLRYACRRGSRGMTTDHLRRLHDFLGVPASSIFAAVDGERIVAVFGAVCVEVGGHRRDDSEHRFGSPSFGADGDLDIEEAEDPDIEKQLKQLQEKKDRLCRQARRGFEGRGRLAARSAAACHASPAAPEEIRPCPCRRTCPGSRPGVLARGLSARQG